MQNELDNLKRQIQDDKLHAREIHDAQKDEVIKVMEEKESALDSRMLIYISVFVAAFVIAFGFFRWLGKSEIRRIINDQATKEIDGQLKVKLSNSVIDEKLTSLGKPIIEELLKEITESNQKAKINADELEQSSKLYKTLLNELTSRHTINNSFQTSPQEKEKTKEFTQVLDKIKDEKDYTAQDWYLKGMEAYNKRDYYSAITNFSNCLKLNSAGFETFYSFFYRGLSKYRLRIYADAIKDFDECLKLEEKGYVYFIRSSAYEFLGEMPKALEDIEKAIEIEPSDENYLKNRNEIRAKMNT